MKRGDYSGILFREGLIILIITYFCVHGFVEHYGSVPITDLAILWAILIASSLVLLKLLTSIFHSGDKATAFTAVLAIIVLFFGVFQDLLAALRQVSMLSRLTLFFPLTLVVMVLAFIVIKRSHSKLHRFRKFLTILFVIYLVIDVFRFAQLRIHEKNDPSTEDALAIMKKNMRRPSVYLVLLDEYAGNETLSLYYAIKTQGSCNSLKTVGLLW